MSDYRSLGQQVSSEGVSSLDEINAFQEQEFQAFEAKHGRRCKLRDVEPLVIEPEGENDE